VFVQSNLHVFAKDHDNIWQLALDMPNSSTIFKDAGTLQKKNIKKKKKKKRARTILPTQRFLPSAKEIQTTYPNRFFVQLDNKTQSANPCIMTLASETHTAAVTSIAVSNDGTKIATVQGITDAKISVCSN
jgi:hypothetical protein